MAFTGTAHMLFFAPPPTTTQALFSEEIFAKVKKALN